MESVFVDSVDICILDFLADLSIHRRFGSQLFKDQALPFESSVEISKFFFFNILLRAEKEE